MKPHERIPSDMTVTVSRNLVRETIGRQLGACRRCGSTIGIDVAGSAYLPITGSAVCGDCAAKPEPSAIVVDILDLFAPLRTEQPPIRFPAGPRGTEKEVRFQAPGRFRNGMTKAGNPRGGTFAIGEGYSERALPHTPLVAVRRLRKGEQGRRDWEVWMLPPSPIHGNRVAARLASCDYAWQARWFAKLVCRDRLACDAIHAWRKESDLVKRERMHPEFRRLLQPIRDEVQARFDRMKADREAKAKRNSPPEPTGPQFAAWRIDHEGERIPVALADAMVR